MEAVGPEFTITSVLAYAASELLRSRDSSREGQEFRCASGAGATRKVRRARVSTLFCGCRLGWVWQCGPGSVATHNSAVWDSRLASFRQACAAGLRPNRRRLGRLRRRRRWQLADQQQQRRERQHRRGGRPQRQRGRGKRRGDTAVKGLASQHSATTARRHHLRLQRRLMWRHRRHRRLQRRRRRRGGAVSIGGRRWRTLIAAVPSTAVAAEQLWRQQQPGSLRSAWWVLADMTELTFPHK